MAYGDVEGVIATCKRTKHHAPRNPQLGACRNDSMAIPCEYECECGMNRFDAIDDPHRNPMPPQHGRYRRTGRVLYHGRQGDQRVSLQLAHIHGTHSCERRRDPGREAKRLAPYVDSRDRRMNDWRHADPEVELSIEQQLHRGSGIHLHELNLDMPQLLSKKREELRQERVSE